MTTDVLSVHPSTPVADIANLLTHHKISAVPVLDDNGRPLGVVSEEDLLAAAQPEPVATAANVMNRVAVHVANSESTLDRAMLLRSTAELVHQLAASVPGVVAVHDNITYEIAD